MASFDSLHPNKKVYYEFEFEGSTLVFCQHSEPCVYCKKVSTNWVDTSFQAPLCSEECSRSLWAEYEYDAHQKDFFFEKVKTGTKREIATFYRCLILLMQRGAKNIDFAEVNAAICQRWSPGVLRAIKAKAWTGLL